MADEAPTGIDGTPGGAPEPVSFKDIAWYALRHAGLRAWLLVAVGLLSLGVGLFRGELDGVKLGLVVLVGISVFHLAQARDPLERERGVVREGFDKYDVLAIAALCVLLVGAILAAVDSAQS